MADRAIVKEWLEKADEDFRFAEANLKEVNFTHNYASIFSRRLKNIFKSFIIAEGLPFNKVHDLVNLLKVCSGHEPVLESLKEDCITLNAAYIETRYPVHWPTHYTRETAEEAHAAVSAIAAMIKKLLQ